MRRIAIGIALLAGLQLNACTPAAMTPAGTAPVRVAEASPYRLAGSVVFPGREVLLASDAPSKQATVTLCDAANQAIAVGKTDNLGAFTLDPGTAFVPATGSVYVLDAAKAATATGIGGDVCRLRTMVSWTGSAWNSVSGPAIVLNTLTTAVCVIQGLRSGSIPPRDTQSTVTGVTVVSDVPLLKDNWSAVNTMVTDVLGKDQDPVARLGYTGGRFLVLPDAASVVKLDRLDEGTFTDTTLDAAGSLQLSGPKPTPNDSNSELAGSPFQVTNSGNDAVGQVVSDGTYLYTHVWSASYANNSPDALKWKKFGSGYNSTTRGQYISTVGTATSNYGYSAFYWNGGIYQPNNVANQFLRTDTTTGVQTAVTTAATTLTKTRGLPGPPLLFNSDGTYVYVVSLGINGINDTDYNGFTVQVLNPASTPIPFALVRQFTVDTTSYWTDSVLCDGVYLYMVEYRPNAATRLRRYRLSDGAREAEWTFAQTNSGTAFNATANDPTLGSWDSVNKVFWVGNLTNDKIHLLRAGTFTNAGTYLSATLDSGSGAAHYGRLNWTATTPAGTTLTLKVRSADTLADLGAATWYGPTGTGDSYTVSGTSLNSVHSKQRYLQIQATLGSTDPNQTPKLQSLGVEVLP